MKIQSGRFSVCVEDVDDRWPLLEGKGDRCFPGAPIRFKEPFASPPDIHLGITEFDILEDSNTRLKVFASEITNRGFVIHVKTWCDTKVWSVEVDWLAYGKE
jgi:hypothetical protein